MEKKENEAPDIWVRPKDRVIKVNCDAAWSNTYHGTGIRVVARNIKGSIVGGTRKKTSCSLALLVQGLAMMEAIRLPRSKNWENIVFKTYIYIKALLHFVG